MVTAEITSSSRSLADGAAPAARARPEAPARRMAEALGLGPRSPRAAVVLAAAPGLRAAADSVVWAVAHAAASAVWAVAPAAASAAWAAAALAAVRAVALAVAALAAVAAVVLVAAAMAVAASAVVQADADEKRSAEQ